MLPRASRGQNLKAFVEKVNKTNISTVKVHSRFTVASVTIFRTCNKDLLKILTIDTIAKSFPTV